MEGLRNHLEKVRYFQAVVEAGTFRKAAEILRLSQSSLTVAVGKLEGAVGHRLLVRSKRGVRLTASGEAVMFFARDLQFRVEDCEARLRAPAGTVAGRMRLGAYDSIAVYWLPSVLRHLRTQFPALSLSVAIGSSAGLVTQVAAGDIDAAVVVAPQRDLDLRVFELFRDTFGFFGSEGGGYLIGMMTARISDGVTLGDLLRSKGVATDNSLHVESFEIARALAQQGVGMAVLPKRVAALPGAGKVLKLRQDMPQGFGRHRIALVAPSEPNAKGNLVDLVCREIVRLA